MVMTSAAPVTILSGRATLGVMTAKEVLSAALALPPEERVEVIEALEASLDTDGASLDPETLAELERRLAEHRAGVPAVDANEVFSRLLAKYA